MKLEHIYAQIITKLQGISSQARAWSYVLGNIIKNLKPTNHITIDGTKYPEVYQHFPVDIFYITQSHGYAAYDEKNSGYDDNGKYVVYLHIPEKDSKINDEHIISFLNHELRHAFEDYKRISQNKPRFSDSHESKLFYSGDFEKYIRGQIDVSDAFLPIFKALYYTSKIEESAYAETIYDDPNHTILRQIKMYLDRKYLYWGSNYIPYKENNRTLQRDWVDLKNKVKIPILDKFDDYMSFIKWVDDYIQIRAKKIYRKLIKVRYLASVQ